MKIFPSGKGVSVTREVFQSTKGTPIKPSDLMLTNAKDNEIIDLIYDHASSITKTWPELAAVKIYERNV